MSLTWALFAEPPPTAMNPDRELRGMGSTAVVRERISAALGNAVVWFKDGWGQYGDEGCMLEFHVHENEDPVVCVMIRVRGLGATEPLLKVARQNDWCLVDDAFNPVAGW